MDKKEAKKLMKLHGHKFMYCKMCGPAIRCGYCGNNCCNGGSPYNCKDDCAEAYAIQNLYLNPWYQKLRHFFEHIIPLEINRIKWRLRHK